LQFDKLMYYYYIIIIIFSYFYIHSTIQRIVYLHLTNDTRTNDSHKDWSYLQINSYKNYARPKISTFLLLPNRLMCHLFLTIVSILNFERMARMHKKCLIILHQLKIRSHEVSERRMYKYVLYIISNYIIFLLYSNSFS